MSLPVETPEAKDHQQNGKTDKQAKDDTEEMQVDVEQEQNKTEILKTGDEITKKTEEMQVDSDKATLTTPDVNDVPKVDPPNGVGGDETDITASIEDCEKSKEIVIAVVKTDVKADELTPTVDATKKDVVDEVVAVVEKKLDADDEDVDIKKSEPKVENDGSDVSASALSNGKVCESLEVVSNVETSNLVDNIPMESIEAPIIAESIVNTKNTLVVADNGSNVVAIEMTAVAATEIENGEPMESKSVDEKDVDNVMKEEPATEPITETNVTVMDMQPAAEVVLEKPNDVSTKDSTVTADATIAADAPIAVDAPIVADIVTVIPVEEKTAEPTQILSNGSSIADEPKDVPIQVQHEVVLKSDTSADINTSTATDTDTATTQMTEISEVVETNSNNSKEKVSRVEITIEQIDKQLGQTTQTTTHIVKEISITEQKVCGKNIASVPTDNKSEAVTNIDKTSVTEEKICSAVKEIPSINSEIKVDSERVSHNGKCELPTNGKEKSENDSDKENDVETENCEDKLESSSLTAEAVLKKCPETAKSTTPAATPAEA